MHLLETIGFGRVGQIRGRDRESGGTQIMRGVTGYRLTKRRGGAAIATGAAMLLGGVALAATPVVGHADPIGTETVNSGNITGQDSVTGCNNTDNLDWLFVTRDDDTFVSGSAVFSTGTFDFQVAPPIGTGGGGNGTAKFAAVAPGAGATLVSATAQVDENGDTDTALLFELTSCGAATEPTPTPTPTAT